MNIVSKLGKLLTKSVKTHILVLTSAVATTATAANGTLPELLASKEQDAGDNYEHKKKEESNIYTKESKANKKALRAKYNVNRYENGWYSVKNFFRDQDIISKLERENKINEQSDIDDIKESARQYFRDEIGIGKGYSTEKLKKNSEKMTKQFILGITHLPKAQRNELIEVYSSVIGELDADIRAELAKDFVSVAESDAETQCIAKSLAINAEYNVTNKDAFGKFMKQTDAVDYQRTAFANMNENGINETLYSMKNRTEKVNTRINELKSKSVLTNAEKAELEYLELVKQNYSTAGHSAALTGVPANRFTTDEFVETCLQNIYEQAKQLGMLNDVLDLARKYLKEHPEAAQEIINRRNADFETLLKKVVLNRSEVWTANRRYSKQSEKGINNALHSGEETRQTATPDNSGSGVTAPIYTPSENRLLAAWNNKTQSDDKNNKADKESVKYNADGFKEDSENKQSGNSVSAAECQKAMQAGVEEYLKYEKENKIGLIESCVNILNYSQADRNLKQLALTRFKTLISKSNQDFIFENRLNKTAGQIAVESIMDADALASIETFSSSYAKEYAEKRIKETNKQNNSAYTDMRNA